MFQNPKDSFFLTTLILFLVISRANQEIDKVRRTTTAEVARLEAALKKSELKIHGLERGLEQKVMIRI